MRPWALTTYVLSRRRTFARWWEHYVMPEIEIASAAVVLGVDTFRLFELNHRTGLAVHQVASTSVFAFLIAHLIRRYREYRTNKTGAS